MGDDVGAGEGDSSPKEGDDDGEHPLFAKAFMRPGSNMPVFW